MRQLVVCALRASAPRHTSVEPGRLPPDNRPRDPSPALRSPNLLRAPQQHLCGIRTTLSFSPAMSEAVRRPRLRALPAPDWLLGESLARPATHADAPRRRPSLPSSSPNPPLLPAGRPEAKHAPLRCVLSKPARRAGRVPFLDQPASSPSEADARPAPSSALRRRQAVNSPGVGANEFDSSLTSALLSLSTAFVQSGPSSGGNGGGGSRSRLYSEGSLDPEEDEQEPMEGDDEPMDCVKRDPSRVACVYRGDAPLTVKDFRNPAGGLFVRCRWCRARTTASSRATKARKEGLQPEFPLGHVPDPNVVPPMIGGMCVSCPSACASPTVLETDPRARSNPPPGRPPAGSRSARSRAARRRTRSRSTTSSTRTATGCTACARPAGRTPPAAATATRSASRACSTTCPRPAARSSSASPSASLISESNPLTPWPRFSLLQCRDDAGPAVLRQGLRRHAPARPAGLPQPVRRRAPQDVLVLPRPAQLVQEGQEERRRRRPEQRPRR